MPLVHFQHLVIYIIQGDQQLEVTKNLVKKHTTKGQEHLTKKVGCNLQTSIQLNKVQGEFHIAFGMSHVFTLVINNRTFGAGSTRTIGPCTPVHSSRALLL
jgi:hypothetical protein